MLGLGNLDLQLKMMTTNVFNMILFDNFKTGDPIIDAILTTSFLSIITFIFQYFKYSFTVIAGSDKIAV